MSNKQCGLSVIKRPCPRAKFPCNRCAAKIVNSGLQWEVSIPKYVGWFYMEPLTLTAQPDATDNPAILFLDVDPVVIDDVVTPCRFSGNDLKSYSVFGGDPSSGPDWVQDFDWTSWYPSLNWQSFSRQTEVIIQFRPAEMDGDILISPGRWFANLVITQGVYRGTDRYSIAPGGSFRTAGFSLPESSISLIHGTYYKPLEAPCIIDGVERWEREMPTLPRLDNTAHTEETLPEGYQWPSGPVAEPGYEVISTGSFYPSGTANNDNAYYAPPYLDMKHIKKS